MKLSTRVAVLGAALFIIILAPPPVSAQQLAARSDETAVVQAATQRLDMLVGRSTVIRMDRPITRVSLSTSDIADALVTSPYELLIHGKAPGTISLLVWAANGRIITYDVAVRRDLTALDEQVHQLFPGEPITVSSNGKNVVLSGVVSLKYVAERAASLALGYVDKPENVVNLLRQREGVATDQVMLQVRFAEVSRNALQELGSSFFTGPSGHGDWIGRSTTQQFAAPDFDKDKGLVFSDFLNLFLFNSKEQIGTLIKALSTKGLFQSLAEPNLITQDGKEASFLAGGEFPIPVAQVGAGGSSNVTVIFKEFGVRLRFTPTILDDLIHLKIAPEVSTLDYTNAVVLGGFRIPALSTRRTETEVELRDGQTFAVAGLLDNRVNETMSRMPGIGDIPILGYLFRSRAYQKNTTELVVMITPRIVKRDSFGVTPNLPAPLVPYLGPTKRLAVPPPAFSEGQSRVVTDQNPDPVKPSATQRTPAPVTLTSKASAMASAAPAVSPATVAASPAPAADPEAEKQAQKAQLEALRKTMAREQKAALEQQRVAEEARKQQEQQDKVNAAAAAKATAAKAKADQEEAARAREEEATRAAATAKEAARAREIAQTLEKEDARNKAEQAKLKAEHQEEERKLAERRKAAEAKLAKEQARRDEALLKALSQGTR
jgi:pilus assembly protein CpaC